MATHESRVDLKWLCQQVLYADTEARMVTWQNHLIDFVNGATAEEEAAAMPYINASWDGDHAVLERAS